MTSSCLITCGRGLSLDSGQLSWILSYYEPGCHRLAFCELLQQLLYLLSALCFVLFGAWRYHIGRIWFFLICCAWLMGSISGYIKLARVIHFHHPVEPARLYTMLYF